MRENGPPPPTSHFFLLEWTIQAFAESSQGKLHCPPNYIMCLWEATTSVSCQITFTSSFVYISCSLLLIWLVSFKFLERSPIPLYTGAHQSLKCWLHPQDAATIQIMTVKHLDSGRSLTIARNCWIDTEPEKFPKKLCGYVHYFYFLLSFSSPSSHRPSFSLYQLVKMSGLEPVDDLHRKYLLVFSIGPKWEDKWASGKVHLISFSHIVFETSFIYF